MASKPSLRYVIVTGNALKNAFQELARYRDGMFGPGITAVVTIEEIAASQQGADIQEQIFNYLKSKYVGEGLEYAMLGGDETIVKHYLTGITFDGENVQVPSDLYYSVLDPELGEYYPAVTVGRIPVRTSEQVSAYIGKLKNNDLAGLPALLCRRFSHPEPMINRSTFKTFSTSLRRLSGHSHKGSETLC